MRSALDGHELAPCSRSTFAARGVSASGRAVRLNPAQRNCSNVDAGMGFLPFASFFIVRALQLCAHTLFLVVFHKFECIGTRWGDTLRI